VDSVAKLDADERANLFSETAARVGVAPWVAEKDFWVCWTLSKLFPTPADHPPLLFKGGTSLSKVFRVIQRFSEDIDISVNKAALGFEGARDPELAAGGRRKALIDELEEEAKKYVTDRLHPHLKGEFEKGLDSADGWGLEVQEGDGGMELLFDYPRSPTAPTTGYSSTTVLVQIGAKADHEPATRHQVSPYAYEYFSNYFSVPHCEVLVLDAERTFWEKATILHAHYHGGPDKVKDRLARHYYDLYMLSTTELGKRAAARLDLLGRVVQYKRVYHSSAWARYEEAKIGSLRLAPSDDVATIVRKDFEQMVESGYFYGDAAPDFNQIVDGLRDLEGAINRS